MTHPHLLAPIHLGEQKGIVGDFNLREAVFTLITFFDAPTQLVGHQLHAIADSQNRNPQIPNGRVAVRCPLAVHAGGTATKNHTTGLERGELRGGRIESQNLREHLALANSPRNHLRILRTEIENDDLFAHLLPMPTPCTVWKTFPSVLMAGAMMISVS